MPFLILAVLITLVPMSSEAGQTAPSWTQSGAFEEIVVTADTPTGLPQLTAASDLIVEASIIAHRSFLDRDGSRIWTDYSVRVGRGLKSANGHNIDEIVTVRRRGGVLTDGSRSIISTENDFPPFQVGEQYVFFLRRTQDRVVLDIVSGRHGATRIVDGAMTTFGPLSEVRESVLKSVRGLSLSAVAPTTK